MKLSSGTSNSWHAPMGTQRKRARDAEQGEEEAFTIAAANGRHAIAAGTGAAAK